jgi:hypothetical protein
MKNWLKKVLRSRTFWRCDEPAGERRPLMTRHTLLTTKWGNLYLHVFHSSDDEELHDHPWDFTTFILWRGYLEEVPLYPIYDHTYHDKEMGRRQKRVWPGMVLRRRAEWRHRVVLVNDKPAVTMLWVSKKRREWGFFGKDGKWTQWEQRHKERGCL